MYNALVVAFGSAVGLSLGLTGGGGSILAVPLLVYGLGLDLRAAVAMSLAVVGLTSLFGAIIQAKSGQVLWKAGVVLGVGGIAAAPLGARLGEAMPDDVVLILFAVLMVFVGVHMVLGSKSGEVPVRRFGCDRDDAGNPKTGVSCIAKLAGSGAVAGVLSGLFGVGGGFLLVPALVWVGSVRIDRALATSLVAIALISVSGFLANKEAAGELSWTVALLFGIGAVVGMIGGARLKGYLSQVVLSRVFAAVAIGAGLYVVAQVLL